MRLSRSRAPLARVGVLGYNISYVTEVWGAVPLWIAPFS
jgi:hypothetical protein